MHVLSASENQAVLVLEYDIDLLNRDRESPFLVPFLNNTNLDQTNKRNKPQACPALVIAFCCFWTVSLQTALIVSNLSADSLTFPAIPGEKGGLESTSTVCDHPLHTDKLRYWQAQLQFFFNNH